MEKNFYISLTEHTPQINLKKVKESWLSTEKYEPFLIVAFIYSIDFFRGSFIILANEPQR